MKNVRKTSWVLVCSMILFMTACSSTKAVSPIKKSSVPKTAEAKQTSIQPEYTLKMACSSPAESIGARVGNKYKELIEKNSKNRIRVDFYPDAQLGPDDEILEGCVAGNIQVAFMTTAPAVKLIPQLGVFDLPNAFVDIPSAYKVLSGTFKDKISGYYSKAGLKLQMFAPVGFRVMSSNRAVRKFEDFRGVKIRTMDNPYHTAFWKALGAVPSTLPFSELYVALQQGIVDAQENPIDNITLSKFYEKQKYIINTNHIMFIATTLINKNVYDGMPVELKEVLEDAARQAGEYYMQLRKEAEKQSVKICEDNGLEVIDLPAEEMKKIQEASKPVYDMIRGKVGDELVNTLLREIESAKR